VLGILLFDDNILLTYENASSEDGDTGVVDNVVVFMFNDRTTDLLNWNPLGLTRKTVIPSANDADGGCTDCFFVGDFTPAIEHVFDSWAAATIAAYDDGGVVAIPCTIIVSSDTEATQINSKQKETNSISQSITTTPIFTDYEYTSEPT